MRALLAGLPQIFRVSGTKAEHAGPAFPTPEAKPEPAYDKLKRLIEAAEANDSAALQTFTPEDIKDLHKHVMTSIIANMKHEYGPGFASDSIHSLLQLHEAVKDQPELKAALPRMSIYDCSSIEYSSPLVKLSTAFGELDQNKVQLILIEGQRKPFVYASDAISHDGISYWDALTPQKNPNSPRAKTNTRALRQILPVLLTYANDQGADWEKPIAQGALADLEQNQSIRRVQASVPPDVIDYSHEA